MSAAFLHIDVAIAKVEGEHAQAFVSPESTQDKR